MKNIKFKLVIFASYFLIISPSFSEESKYIEQTEEIVFDIQLDKQAIMKRAEACIIKNIKNDSVVLVGTSSGTSGLFGIGKRDESATVVPQGEVIKYKDAESGVIYANNRIEVKANLINYSVQTSVNFFVKDNKFKIGHKEIVYLQKDVGYGTPDSYKKLPKKGAWGSSLTPKALSALTEVTQNIASCVQSSSDENW